MSDQKKPQARDGAHKFEYSLAAAERDAKAAEMRARGKSYKEIAEALGYYDRSHVWRALQTAKKRVLSDAIEDLISIEMQELDDLYVAAMEIRDRDHILVSQGKTITGADGEPLLDDGPRLAAIREMRMLRESFRKLYGLDAEKKVNISGGVRYEIVGIDPADLS